MSMRLGLVLSISLHNDAHDEEREMHYFVT